MAPGGTDTSVVNKLLGQFEQQSGQSVSSPGFNFDSLAQFATEQTGSSIPREILEQIIKAKVQQVRQNNLAESRSAMHHALPAAQVLYDNTHARRPAFAVAQMI
jgi:hypothetical protein